MKQNDSTKNESQSIPKSLRIKQCLQKFTHSKSSSKSQMRMLSSFQNDTNNTNAANAATKLCNLASSQSNLLFAFDIDPTPKTTSKLSKFKSVSDLFNTNGNTDSKSDFIDHFESSSKGSLKTSTVTLGRRFKKNVMKLSIFNVFAAAAKEDESLRMGDSNIQNTLTDDSSVFKELFETSENVFGQSAINTASNTQKSTKVKILKKQKKLKKLMQEKQLQAETTENDMMYRTI